MIVEQELLELKARVSQLEVEMHRLTKGTPTVTPSNGPILSQDEAIAWLKSQGMIAEPTQEMLVLAAEWENLPEDDRQAHIQFMNNLHLDPPLSQIVLDNRR